MVHRSIIQRAAAFFLDAAIIGLITIAIRFLIRSNFELDLIFESRMLFLIQIVVYFLYFFFAESFFLTTVGKRISGYKITGKVNIFNIFKRTIIRFIPFEPISFLFDDNSKLWHEKWSGAYTVRDEKRVTSQGSEVK